MQITTSALMFEEYEAEIRLTLDQKISVFDLIRVVGQQKNPKEVWRRLCLKDSADYKEVVTFCDYFQFPGQGQRPTPVITKQGALILLGVLPGEVGKKYRLAAAELMLKFLQAPEELAKAAIARVEDPEKLKAIASEAMAKYIHTYHPLFDEIRDRVEDADLKLHSYRNVNSLNTKTVLGSSPKEVVAIRGGKSARSMLTSEEHSRFAVLHDLQLGALEIAQAQNKAVYETCKSAAVDFASLLRKYGR